MTAQDTVESKLQGFRLGADDYICKPYHPQELVARVHALMRRVKHNSQIGMPSIRVGRIELFPADLKVVINDSTTYTLTHTEMMVLRVLMSHAEQSVSRDQLLTEVWNDEENSSNIVDVYIRRLRTKLEPDANKPRHILSMRGIGYKFTGK
jgi:DNA-binding response OmpR family regulator